MDSHACVINFTNFFLASKRTLLNEKLAGVFVDWIDLYSMEIVFGSKAHWSGGLKIQQPVLW